MCEISFYLNEDSCTYAINKDGVVKEDYMQFVNDFETTVDIYLNRLVSDITGSIVENLGDTKYTLEKICDATRYKKYVLEEK